MHNRQRLGRLCLLGLLIISGAFAPIALPAAADGQSTDPRTPVAMPAPVGAHMLATMRDHLGALQAIIQALSENRLQQAASIAEQRLGMASMQDPQHHKQLKFMPEHMRQLGAGMHKLAGTFALTAQNSDIDGDARAPYRALSAVVAQCMACHQAYRLVDATAPGNKKPGSLDARVSMHLTPGEQAAFLADMRVMLGSVHGILQGVAEGDRDAIARAAKQSGNRMPRSMSPTIKAKSPPEFQKIGGPTHLAFEEIAVRAETDPIEEITALTAETMNRCMACHARFQVK